MIGAVRPSSRFLVKKMISKINFSEARIIVELGPGTGVFTEKIMKKMRPDCRLFVFELNTTFYHHLKEKYKDERCVFINDSAEYIEKYLKEFQVEQADYILSSLPLANFPDRLRMRLVLECSRNLTSHGKFLQFQYSTQSKGLFENVFKHIETDFTLLNFPPAFVFSCYH